MSGNYNKLFLRNETELLWGKDMDYRYLKKEVEEEKNKNRKNLMELYDCQEDFLIKILYNNIVSQVKEEVRRYYQYSYVSKNKHLGIQSPTLFKRYYTYEGRAEYIICKISDDSKITGNLYDSIHCWDSEWPCISIPESKFATFLNLLDEKLMKDSIRIQLEPNSFAGYDIHIIANLGKL